MKLKSEKIVYGRYADIDRPGIGNAGVSLIELIVALLILSIIVVPLMGVSPPRPK